VYVISVAEVSRFHTPTADPKDQLTPQYTGCFIINPFPYFKSFGHGILFQISVEHLLISIHTTNVKQIYMYNFSCQVD